MMSKLYGWLTLNCLLIKYAEKLESLEMKDERGFEDGRKDISDCRVAFATEN